MLFILMLLFPARPRVLQGTTDTCVESSLLNSCPTSILVLSFNLEGLY